GVEVEGQTAISRVKAAGGVTVKRRYTGCRIDFASGVAEESLITDGRVPDTAGKTLEGLISFGRVEAGIASVRRRVNCWRHLAKAQADQRRRQNNQCCEVFWLN